jgi:hypothetical protein
VSLATSGLSKAVVGGGAHGRLLLGEGERSTSDLVERGGRATACEALQAGVRREACEPTETWAFVLRSPRGTRCTGRSP